MYLCEKKIIWKIISRTINNNQLSFLEIKINKYHRNNIGRPTVAPKENKKLLMNKILDKNVSK